MLSKRMFLKPTLIQSKIYSRRISQSVFAHSVKSRDVAQVQHGEPRFVRVKYVDGERKCPVLTENHAVEAILQNGAENYVKVINSNSDTFLQLQQLLEKVWQEVVFEDEVADDDLLETEFVKEDWEGDEGFVVYERYEGSEELKESEESSASAGVEDFPDLDLEEELGPLDESGPEEPLFLAVERAALHLLREYFPESCTTILRGGEYSRGQVPDLMFRGASEVQPNFAEFLHRDIDTCTPPRSLELAMPQVKKASYRFYNVWIARTADAGQLDATGQVSTDPMVILLPREGGTKEWRFSPPAAWDSDRLFPDPDHTFITAPYLIFDASDLWHGAAKWWDQDQDQADRENQVDQVDRQAQSAGTSDVVIDNDGPDEPAKELVLSTGDSGDLRIRGTRQSIELRFRCRCCPETDEGCELSPITAAYRSGGISNYDSRQSEASYEL